MKYKWLNFSKNDKLIIFFNGWGMDENAVKHLKPEAFDVLMFYDYNSLESDFNDYNDYNEINIIGWSMGVMISSIVISQFNIKYNKYTAINGTHSPIDKNFGINPKVYDLMIERYNEHTFEKFVKKMSDNELKEINIESISRTEQDRKSELVKLKSYKGDSGVKPTRIIIGNNDKIIPTKNQSAYWGIGANIECGHYPFHLFTKWSELL